MIQRPPHIEHYSGHEDDLGKMAAYALHLEGLIRTAMTFVPREWESAIATRLRFEWGDLDAQSKKEG